MEGGESLLDTIFDEGSFGDDLDVEMLDVEEGELIDPLSKTGVGESFDVGGNQVNQGSGSRKNPRHRKKKKSKRKKGNSTGPNVNDASRFVVDACKRLRERKHYLMWTAVGCLGVSALSDLVKEVDAIQACGGQKTADGKRFRNGGGILWNIIKAREPNAYKEIMTKGREFEARKSARLARDMKQLKHPLQDKQGLKQHTEASSHSTHEVKRNPSDGLELTSNIQSDLEKTTFEQKQASVHDRIRVPVSYDDLLVDGEGDPKEELS